MRRSGAQFDHVAVSPAPDLKCTLPGSTWPAAPAPDEFYAVARELFPGVRIGGMFSCFTELNRKRPPTAALDFVCHTTCPIVHAGDDLSVTESLESLPSIFRSVRAFGGGRPYWLFPTAIAMRQNPYGALPAENPGGGRIAMGRTDPRERGLLGAAWYAGYLARAAYAGLAGMTLAAAAGPSGVIYTRQAHAQPWFDNTPDAAVLPSYHVLRGHAALAGQSLISADTSAPRDVQALAVAVPSDVQVWLSNLTGRRQRVRVEGTEARSAEIRHIDTTTFERLCRAPDAFELLAQPASPGEIVLGAYAVARLDLRV